MSLVLLFALLAIVLLFLRADEATRAATLARDEARRSAEGELLARAEIEQVLRLADGRILQQLVDQAEALWPPHPEMIPEMESWEMRARSLVAQLPAHVETLSRLRARAHPEEAGDPGLEPRRRPHAEELEHDGASPPEGSPGRSWSFDSHEDQWQHDARVALVSDLERLAEDLLSEDAVTPEHGWSLPRRLAFARQLADGFAAGGPYREAWTEALPRIHEAYPGLELSPQMGLLPLGPDPDSGLWEFAHLLTGTPAERGPDGKLVLAEETGVVLVLLPGGSFWMGAQPDDREGPNYDPRAQNDEGPAHEVELSAFFLSKYELTQGQFLRLCARNPSLTTPDRWSSSWVSFTDEGSLLHPVERISWMDCRTWLPRFALGLPSEAQWEYAARAGTSTPWWSGVERQTLAGRVNVADRYAREHGGSAWSSHEHWLDDGATTHTPVGSYEPNGFGLHDVIGNVWEWCLDGYQSRFYESSEGPDPVATWTGDGDCVTRGGSFCDNALLGRSAIRRRVPRADSTHYLGVRPARAIDP